MKDLLKKLSGIFLFIFIRMVFFSHFSESFFDGILISQSLNSEQLIAVIVPTIAIAANQSQQVSDQEDKDGIDKDHCCGDEVSISIIICQQQQLIVYNMNDRTAQLQTKKQPLSNEESYSASPLRQSHLTPIDASSVRYQVNYIKQYFQVKDLFNIPEISISNFYQKIHKLRSILRQDMQNPKLHLQTEYKIKLPIKLSSLFDSNAQMIENKIKQTDVINFQLVIEDISENLLSIYFGQVHNDKKQGYGVSALFQKEDQSNQKLLTLYQGFYEHGLKNGVGLQWERDTLYIGNFVNDLQFTYQNSVILYDTGDLYVGSMINKRKSGKGVYFKLKNKKNQFYKYQSSKKPLDYEYLIAGLWENDKIAANNNLLLTTGLKDILQINLFKVPANLLVKNNSIYCGDITQKIQVSKQKQVVFLKWGKGFEFFSNGDIYKGQYTQDKPHGFGHYFWANKDQYLGQIKEGIRQGKGKWNGQNGQSFEGQYESDQRCGYGIYKWPNGDCYEGEFKEDLRNGLGKMSWSNGQTYIGYWKRGLQHGDGQIHINLRFANFHRKIKFNKGSPVIKSQDISKHLSQTIQQKIKIKNKLGELSIDKGRLISNKNDAPTQMKRRSLGQLKQTKKNRFTPQKIQSHSKSLIHESFLKLRQKYDDKMLTNDNREIQTKLEKKIDKFEIQKDEGGQIDQNQINYYSQEKNKKNRLLFLESKLRSITDHTPMKKKQYCKNKFLIKQKTVHHNSEILCETLLRPIKWANFKQSWQQKEN